MGLFTKEQEEKFVIICEKVFPEFMLRKAENDNLLGIAFSDEKADMYSVLYKYDCDFLNFVLGRLHYYVVMWFENNNSRLYKGNSYLTVESRREIKSFVSIFGYFKDFFSRNGISFEIEKLYKKKILEVDEIISRVKCREVNLPDDYQPIEKNIIDAMKIDGENNIKNIIRVKFPLSIPYLLVGMASSFALAFKIEIMAEVLTGDTTSGVGAAILAAQRNDPSNMVPIFAYSFIAIFLVLIIDLISILIKNKLR